MTRPLMSRSKAKRRPPLWLALRIPHLSLEALGHHYNSATPVIISDKRRVYRCNALALAEGITHGMPLSTAQSLVDGLLLERDPEKEQEALQQIAKLCYQFTPYIEFYGDASADSRGLLLEISRSLTLFGGVENLAQALTRTLANDPQVSPYRCQYGLAHTGKAAWLLSWQNHPINARDDQSAFLQRLRQVPVDHLREYPDVVTALHKSGFQTLGDLMVQLQGSQSATQSTTQSTTQPTTTSSTPTLSSAAFTRRFGPEFSTYLEQILGGGEASQGQLFTRPPETFTPDQHFQEHIQFDYPITDVEQLRDPMQQLLEKLTDKLRRDQQQSHGIEWRFFDIYQNRQTLSVNSERIHSDWRLPLDLTMIQLEHTQLEFAVDSLELACNSTTPVELNNHQLLNRQLSHTLQEDSEKLFTRLSARLGKKALSKMSYHDDTFPENCQQQIAITEASQTQLPPQHLNAPRPSWLFNPPQAIQQADRQLFWHGPLQIIQGPERLQGHWWNSPTARDYFMAQRNDHVRCWVYQDLKSRQWYVHGVFA